MRIGAGLLLTLAVLSPASARAATFHATDPDSAVREFLKQLSDSTTDYFGVSAADRDTAGLDSALAARLGGAPGPRRRLPRTFVPALRFNRADAVVYELGYMVGAPRMRVGELFGSIAWANGPDDVLWRLRLNRTFGGRDQPWRLRLVGENQTEVMDRERSGSTLSTLRAMVSGTDRQSYFRTAGYGATLMRDGNRWDAEVSWSDAVHSPLATMATWNFFNSDLSIVENLQATPGRVREVGIGARTDLYLIPAEAEIVYETSGAATGSDFTFRRTRAAVAANWGLGSWAAIVPQAAYGRLNGDVLPQAMFYLGSSSLVRSRTRDPRSGTGYAAGRLELIGTQDILSLLRIPHPAMFPTQLGGFIASGAVWGPDAYGSTEREGLDWPNGEHWVSETGVSLIYQPGLPDPTYMVRIHYIVPLGPNDVEGRWSLTFSKALEVFRISR